MRLIQAISGAQQALWLEFDKSWLRIGYLRAQRSPPGRRNVKQKEGILLTADDFRNSKRRGFMFGSGRPGYRPDPSFFVDAAACGANIGRTFVPLGRQGDTYIVPRGTLETIDFFLQNVKFPIILAMSAPAVNPGEDLWTKKSMQDSLVSIWTEIASRYKDSEAVAGYDLLNEPIYAWPVTTDSWTVWGALGQRIYDAIRKVDPKHVIVICPSPGGIPTSYVFYESYRPIVGTNVVYSLHMYEPYNVTHCGVYAKFPLSDDLYYPGDQPSTAWPPGIRDKSYLEHLLAYPRRWSLTYNVPMFVAEFSCVRWAPRNSRDVWLRDNINLFNQYGWSWAYLAWRGWPGWDAENQSTSTVLDNQIYNPYWSTITMLRRAFSASFAGKQL
jgi:aryl-phospho-beta-D-glucosidase BglC (GH1 family)